MWQRRDRGGDKMPADPTQATLLPTPVTGNDPALRTALGAAHLPVADLAEPGRSLFSYATPEGAAAGFGGVEPLGRHALIRAIWVPETLRQHGFGSAILSHLLDLAGETGAQTAWALAPSAAAPFLRRRGFREVARYEAPPEVLSSRHAGMVCPISTVILTRPLGG